MPDPRQPRWLTDIARGQAAERGGEVAIEFEGRTTTYAELEDRSSRLAQALLAAGVQPGERVGALTRNNDRFYELLFAAAKVRACLAPINFRLAAGEVAFIVGDCAPRLLFVSQELLGLASAALEQLESPPRVILLDAEGGGDCWPGFIATGPAEPAPLPAPRDDDDVIQLYTSGTTGLPKGVRITNANYSALFDLARTLAGFYYEPGEAVLNIMPLFHVAGANVGMIGLANGCRLVVVKEFEPAAVLGLIERQRIARSFFVPAMINMMLQAPEIETADLSSLKAISYGASPISEAVLVDAKARFGCEFVQLYGMTESLGAATELRPEQHEGEQLRSCGRPWPGLDVEVLGPDDRPLPPREVGEICIRGRTVMPGYFNRPEATADTIRDGWLHTGDAGFKDEAGFLYIHDRMKDMIVSGGENIYPAEVENAIFGCPGLADAAVIGVPSEKWGEEVKAVVVAAPGCAPDPDAVIAWAKGRIAGYKCPKSVDYIEALPRNASGKVLRRQLREPYWKGQTRGVA